MKTFAHCLCVLVVMILLSAGVDNSVAAPKDDYKKMKGYVDLNALGNFDEADARVEVLLKGSLLVIAREAMSHEDPELSRILAGIRLVRVNVFPLDEEEGEAVIGKLKGFTQELEKKGWEVAVRVREEDEHVYIHILPGENDKIEGLVIMVAEFDRGRRHSDQEFTFVNIVGTINPEDIGRLGRAMDIKDLDIDGFYFDSDQARDAARRDRERERKERGN